MTDVVVVTIDSVRADHVEHMPSVEAMDPVRATTAAHYTRPSLAALQTGRYASALASRPTGPTLASVLADEGYETAAVAPTPQLHPSFGFDEGFRLYENHGERGSRCSSLRERLSRFGPLRRIYHRVNPPHATLDGLPTDREVVDTALDIAEEATDPLYLWVHLMGSHRPYGREDGISRDLDRRALFDPSSLSSEDRERIEDAYRRSLGRAETQVARLLDAFDDAVVAVTSDHGEELGEDGRYFHQPQRRRLVDGIVHVPLAFRGPDPGDAPASLIDVAPTVLGSLGIEAPRPWDGVDLDGRSRDHTVALAPWGASTAVRVSAGDRTIVTDAMTVELDGVVHEDADVPEELKERLSALGYRE